MAGPKEREVKRIWGCAKPPPVHLTPRSLGTIFLSCHLPHAPFAPPLTTQHNYHLTKTRIWAAGRIFGLFAYSLARWLSQTQSLCVCLCDRISEIPTWCAWWLLNATQQIKHDSYYGARHLFSQNSRSDGITREFHTVTNNGETIAVRLKAPTGDSEKKMQRAAPAEERGKSLSLHSLFIYAARCKITGSLPMLSRSLRFSERSSAAIFPWWR